jgi:ribosomal protein L7/L12
MFSLFSSAELSQADAARLRRIEQKLDLILAHLGLAYEPASTLDDEARRLADAGRKIEAIKAYREATGAGLADAKEAVEDYLRGR